MFFFFKLFFIKKKHVFLLCITTHLVFEDELDVKLYAMNVEVWTSTNENPRQYKVTMGRVHSPGSTNN